MGTRKNELMFRCAIQHNTDAEWSRACALSSALETAGHALYTVCALLSDDDFGEAFWEELEAVAAPLLKKAQAVRERNEERSNAHIGAVKARMGWQADEENDAAQAGAEGG